MEIKITACDYCNTTGSTSPHNGRGLVECTERDAIELFDWEFRDEGIMCPECQDDADEGI